MNNNCREKTVLGRFFNFRSFKNYAFSSIFEPTVASSKTYRKVSYPYRKVCESQVSEFILRIPTFRVVSVILILYAGMSHTNGTNAVFTRARLQS